MSGVVPNIASIIVDGTSLKANFICLNAVRFVGMDQKKTCIPFDSVEQGSAADVASLRIPQMVFGGIIHGLGKYFYVSDNLVNNLKGADLGKLVMIIVSSIRNLQHSDYSDSGFDIEIAAFD